MARGVNKVILVGNLGNDPEVRSTNNGSTMTTVSIATSESWKDRQTGQQQERTEWHRVVFFNRLAEIARDYLKKGSKVYVEGSLRTRKWQDQDGKDRYTTEIMGNEMQMLDGRGAGGGMGGGEYSQSSATSSSSGSRAGSAPPPMAEPAGGFDSFDDDIPF